MFNDLNLFAEQDMRTLANQRMAVTASDRTYDVYAHGNDRIVLDGKTALDASHLAELIRNDPTYDSGMAVKLWSCNTGSKGMDSIAQKLADVLQTNVIAPNKFVWYKDQTVPYVSGKMPLILRPIFGNHSTLSGQWLQFSPSNGH
jgi:hypothetical protein